MRKNILTILIVFSGIMSGYSQSEKNDLKVTISGLPLYGASAGFGSGINGYAVKPSIAVICIIN